jgi:hypothetical protein
LAESVCHESKKCNFRRQNNKNIETKKQRHVGLLSQASTTRRASILQTVGATMKMTRAVETQAPRREEQLEETAPGSVRSSSYSNSDASSVSEQGSSRSDTHDDDDDDDDDDSDIGAGGNHGNGRGITVDDESDMAPGAGSKKTTSNSSLLAKAKKNDITMGSNSSNDFLQMAKILTQVVLCSKVLVYVVLVLAAAAAGAVTYIYTLRAGNAAMTSQLLAEPPSTTSNNSVGVVVAGGSYQEAVSLLYREYGFENHRYNMLVSRFALT